MGTRIFLTGVSGYLGSVLAERLAHAAEVEQITGIDVATPMTSLPPKVEFVEMDIRSPDLAAAMAGHEVVVHTAFIVQWLAKMPARERDDINFGGIRNVAQAAAANGVRRFVQASSLAAYDADLIRGKTDVTEETPIGKGDSSMYYWNGKAAAERTLLEVLGASDTVLTLLRPTYIIGPRNRAMVEGLRQNPVNIPGLDPRVQYVHEDDVAAAFLQAVAGDMPGAYNVVPDDFVRGRAVWQILGLTSVPTAPYWLAHLLTGFRWRFQGAQTHPSWLEAMVTDATASNAKLRATGWTPGYGSAEALRSAL